MPLGRIGSETEPPNLPTEKNAGCCAFGAPIPPSPVRVRESPTAKTPRNRGNFGDASRTYQEFSATADLVAERVGFEPTVPFGTHAFQACALSRSAISPEN